jgi:glutamate/tyrosine decarboxylase-like PLP-dependent enzyme
MDTATIKKTNQEILSAFPLVASLFKEEHDDLSSKPILSLASAATVSSLRELALPEGPHAIEAVINEAQTIFAHRIRNDHPRFFGFIPSPTSPISFLGHILSSLYNVHAGSWLQSSGPSAIEASLIHFLSSKVGFPDDGTAGGVFVSGGSMANLTALMVARDQMLTTQEERMRGVVYMSAQTHLSIAKALRVLGFMDSQIRKVGVDAKFRMDIESLKQSVRGDREAGLLPFCIVGSCGTTNTGSIDPLNELADFAEKERSWLHVDGAYGASIVLSNSRGHLADGLGKAHSVSWDAHKWLFQTFGCGIVLLRNKKHLLGSFATEAEYVRDAVAAEESPNFWNHGLELTRPARAMKLWFTMRVLGLEEMGRMIDHGLALAERAEEELRKLAGWEVLSLATLGIVVFRYKPAEKSEGELDRLNIEISKKLLEQSIAGALTTKLNGMTVLRMCAISPELSLDEMSGVVTKMDQVARSPM